MKKLLVILALLPCLAKAQTPKLDSLKAELQQPANDTAKAKALYLIAKEFIFVSPDSSLKYSTEALKLSKKIKYQSGKGFAYHFMGYAKYIKGDYEGALKYWQLALTERKKEGNKKLISSSIGNLGNVYVFQGNHPEALKYFYGALKMDEAIGDKNGIANRLNSIAIVYASQNELEKALDHFKRSLSIHQELGREIASTNSMGNIGNMHARMGNYDEALKAYKNTIEILEKHGQLNALPTWVDNIGSIYYMKEDYERALEYQLRAIELENESTELLVKARHLANAGSTYIKLKQYDKGEEFLLKALEMNESIGALPQVAAAKLSLSTLYTETGKHDKALVLYREYITDMDSVHDIEQEKEAARIELQYQFEKKEAIAKAEQEKKDALAREEEEKNRLILYGFIGGFILMMVLAFVLFRSNKRKQRDNQIIKAHQQETENQKQLVEQKNREILDSITYAKRIQEAILPPAKLVKEYLQQSFILYKPKDIVAGDFYWMETVGDTVYFSAADCTGHGVPGAMVSVVCSNALSKALIEENITDVGQLLDRTRELVVERFGRSEENIQDGMDLALCALNTKTNELHYAGANNPLWIIRKGAAEVEETKADKQPIGKYDKEDPFTTHTLQLNQGDSLYIFSDGYPDQFGGEKGKKYKTGAMKKFLLSIQDKDMAAQRQLLNEEFESWKGNLEQIDDVCVIGVRV